MFSPRRLPRRNDAQPLTPLDVNHSQQAFRRLRDHKQALFAVDALHFVDGERVGERRSGSFEFNTVFAEILLSFDVVPFKLSTDYATVFP